MKTVTEREPAKPVPKALTMSSGDSPAINPAAIPDTATTSMAFSRRAKPTTTMATARRTHMRSAFHQDFQPRQGPWDPASLRCADGSGGEDQPAADQFLRSIQHGSSIRLGKQSGR